MLASPPKNTCMQNEVNKMSKFRTTMPSVVLELTTPVFRVQPSSSRPQPTYYNYPDVHSCGAAGTTRGTKCGNIHKWNLNILVRLEVRDMTQASEAIQVLHS